MNKISAFECEYCKEIYKDEERATKCEMFHAVVADISSMYVVDNKYPTKIKVKMSDGIIVEYVYYF